MVEEKFLIDANTLISPYKNFYPFDFAPSFWEQLSLKMGLNSVAILDMAKDEVIKGTDELSIWIKKIPDLQICRHEDSEIIAVYAQVLSFLQTSPYYSDKALREWSKEEIADPWLIAAAAVHGYTIITFEQSAGPLSHKSPCGRAKIPDVGNAFGVRCENLYYFMREMSFKL